MEHIIIFTDGASKGNPGPGGWGVVIVFPLKDGMVQELGGAEQHTTNNRMEITAALKALSFISSHESINLYTDSRYLINGITKWIFGWRKNGWITGTNEEVLNRDLWEELGNICRNKKITWNYIGGHSGIVGNERCDEIATGFASGGEVKLYNGSIEKYAKNILDFSIDEEKAVKKSTSARKAYSYVSLVDGVFNIDKTWSECEARVKGKTGAKYKKSFSKEDEAAIIAEWGK